MKIDEVKVELYTPSSRALRFNGNSPILTASNVTDFFLLEYGKNNFLYDKNDFCFLISCLSPTLLTFISPYPAAGERTRDTYNTRMSCQEKRTAGYRIQADSSEETATLRTASIPQPAIIYTGQRKKETLFLFGKHRIPGRQLDRLLTEKLHHLFGHILRLDYQTEHIFVKPAVGHDEVSLPAARRSPAVLH